MNTDDLRDQLTALHHDQSPASAMNARLAVQRKANQQNQRRFVAVAATAAVVLGAIGVTATRGRESAQGFSNEPKVETDDGSVPRLVPDEIPAGMTLQWATDYGPSGITAGSAMPLSYPENAVDGRVVLYARPGDDLATGRSVAVLTIITDEENRTSPGRVDPFANGLRTAGKNTVNERSAVGVVGRGLTDAELLQVSESATVSGDGLDVLAVVVPEGMVEVGRSRVGSFGLPFGVALSFLQPTAGYSLTYGSTSPAPPATCCDSLLTVQSFREVPNLETFLRWEYGLRPAAELNGAPAFEGQIDLGYTGNMRAGRATSASSVVSSDPVGGPVATADGRPLETMPAIDTTPATSSTGGDPYGASMLVWHSAPGVVSVLQFAGPPNALPDLRRLAASMRVKSVDEFNRYLASTTTSTLQAGCRKEGTDTVCSSSGTGAATQNSPTTLGPSTTVALGG